MLSRSATKCRKVLADDARQNIKYFSNDHCINTELCQIWQCWRKISDLANIDLFVLFSQNLFWFKIIQNYRLLKDLLVRLVVHGRKVYYFTHFDDNVQLILMLNRKKEIIFLPEITEELLCDLHW